MAYFQIGVIQALAGYIVFIVVMSQNGFIDFIGRRAEWELSFKNDMVDNYGQEWVRTYIFLVISTTRFSES